MVQEEHRDISRTNVGLQKKPDLGNLGIGQRKGHNKDQISRVVLVASVQVTGGAKPSQGKKKRSLATAITPKA